MRFGLVVLIAVLAGCNGPATSPTDKISLTAEMKRDVGAAIRDRGYNCPEPKLAYAEGADAHGDVVKLYCGPTGTPGVYEKAVFRITFTPSDLMLIEPW